MDEDLMEETLGLRPRIFVNNLDTYLSGNLGHHLATCKPGQALDEEEQLEEDVEDLAVEPEPVRKSDLSGYRIIGTLSRPDAKAPSYAETILSYEDRRDFYEHISTCDCIIYDITGAAAQTDEALWVAKSLADDSERFDSKGLKRKGKRTFILITHLLSWARTEVTYKETDRPVFYEEDHVKRRPHPSYRREFEVENLILHLGKKHKKVLATYVIACGIPYGAHEDVFEQFFLKAWMNCRELEVYGEGKNVVPTIHIKDLATIVQAVYEDPPGSRYIVAKDRSEQKLGDIIKAISQSMGTGDTRHLSEYELLRLKDIPKVHVDQLMMDLVIDNQVVSEELSLPWRCEDGMVNNIEKLAQEYVKAKEFKPLRICVLGAPFVGKTSHAIALARHYGLHYIHVTPVLFEAYLRLREPLKALEEERAADEWRRRMEVTTRKPQKVQKSFRPQLLPTATSQDVSDDQLSSATIPPSDIVFPADDAPQTEPPATQPPSPIPEVPEIPSEGTSRAEIPEETLPSEVALLDSLPEEVRKRYPRYPPLRWGSRRELEDLAHRSEAELRDFIAGMKDNWYAEDYIVTKYLRKKLLSKPCQNQGFVLDGYPTTFEQAEALFSDPSEKRKDPRNPTYDRQVTPQHVIYLQGSNALVTHRYRKMLKGEGKTLDGFGDFSEPESVTLNLADEIDRRRGHRGGHEKKGKHQEEAHKKLKDLEQLEGLDLKIEWTPPDEEPRKRLGRRLDKHRSAMAPKATAQIIEEAFQPYKHLLKDPRPVSEVVPPPWPKRALADADFSPLEVNVLTFFDVRELHPFTVDMDRDKSQHLYPGGPQKDTFRRLLKRIAKSPTGEFVRQTKAILDKTDRDQAFVVGTLQQEAQAVEAANLQMRMQAASVLHTNEQVVWREWLKLLKRENDQRQMVKSMPRRNYLLKYVLPKVAECLAIYGQRRPTDPVEFLAEYLIRDAGVNYQGIIR